MADSFKTKGATMFAQKQKIAITFSCLILVVGLMGMDFINPSLPYIMRSFDVSEYTTKYLIVIYLLGLGVSQFFYGTFSDNYGRRKTIIIAFSVSCAGILLAMLSTSMGMLFISRLITGIGAGGAPVVARAIISDVCLEQKSIKKAFAYFSMSSQISPAFAPLIGGTLQQLFNWRMVFLGLAVVTVSAVLLLVFSLKETHAIPERPKEFKEQVFVYANLFKLRRFISFNFASALIFVITISYYSYMPFILYQKGYSSLENGIIYSFYAVSLVLGSFTLSKYLYQLDDDMLLKRCISFFALISVVFIVIFSFNQSFIFILLLTIVVAFVCGVSVPLTLALCMQGFTQNKGAASSVQGFIKMFFTGVALIFFNFLPMENMLSLAACYLIVSILIAISYLIGAIDVTKKIADTNI